MLSVVNPAPAETGEFIFSERTAFSKRKNMKILKLNYDNCFQIVKSSFLTVSKPIFASEYFICCMVKLDKICALLHCSDAT